MCLKSKKARDVEIVTVDIKANDAFSDLSQCVYLIYVKGSSFSSVTRWIAPGQALMVDFAFDLVTEVLHAFV